MAEIRYIRGNDLDRMRWDRLMESTPNADLYGSSIFLDTMTDGWDAVVCNDYEAAIPLPVRSRFGIRYAYILPFCGPFSLYGALPKGVSVETLLKAIPQSLLRCDLKLWIDGLMPRGWKSTEGQNHLLDLSMDYPSIRHRYHPSCKNLLNRGLTEGLHINSSFQVSFQHSLARKFGGLGQTAQRDVLRFERLCERWSETSHLLSLAIISNEGQAMAGGIFLRSPRRLHYLLGWSSPMGKKNNAARHIIDHVIQLHAGKPLILDFEGSDIPGVAHFFESFGAVPFRYQILRRDGMPLHALTRFRSVMRTLITPRNQTV